MVDPAIEAFFAEKKERWLKKNIKSSMNDYEIQEKKHECELNFSLENWLPNAAKRAGQISKSSHPCTFSHPSARTNKNGNVTSIVAQNRARVDGYLRTGNMDVEDDALGNGGALDVYKFLSLIMGDGKTLLNHIQESSALAKDLLTIKSEAYENLRNKFLEILISEDKLVTSSKIKQVYFPTMNGDYHQLSILSNSGIIFELKRRLDNLRFPKEREVRRKNIYVEGGYKQIVDVVTIGYGGTKPQNISVLNKSNKGKSHLLLAIPPNLQKQNIRFPNKDFFIQSINNLEFKPFFQRLDNIFRIENSSISLEKKRKARDRCLGDILDLFVDKTITLRRLSAEQYQEKTNVLPLWQKIWLCEFYQEQRKDNLEWLDELSKRIAHWIQSEYKEKIKNAISLGEAERNFIKEFIDENSEVFI